MKIEYFKENLVGEHFNQGKRVIRGCSAQVSHRFRWCNSGGYLFPFARGTYAKPTERVSFLPRARHLFWDALL
jgi:hypothetical protein